MIDPFLSQYLFFLFSCVHLFQTLFFVFCLYLCRSWTSPTIFVWGLFYCFFFWASCFTNDLLQFEKSTCFGCSIKMFIASACFPLVLFSFLLKIWILVARARGQNALAFGKFGFHFVAQDCSFGMHWQGIHEHHSYVNHFDAITVRWGVWCDNSYCCWYDAMLSRYSLFHLFTSLT